MPQRAAALPSITRSPPWAVAPAAWLASPLTCALPPDIMFSATPQPGMPSITVTVASLVHAGAVIADMWPSISICDRCIEAAGDAHGSRLRIDHAHIGALVGRRSSPQQRLVGSGHGATLRRDRPQLDIGAWATSLRFSSPAVDHRGLGLPDPGLLDARQVRRRPHDIRTRKPHSSSVSASTAGLQAMGSRKHREARRGCRRRRCRNRRARIKAVVEAPHAALRPCLEDGCET